MLAGARLAGIWHHVRAHRFFTAARWRPDHLGLLLCDLIVGRLLGADQPILLAVDDTLFHRASRRLPLAAFHHDPTAPGRAAHRLGALLGRGRHPGPLAVRAPPDTCACRCWPACGTHARLTTPSWCWPTR
jgi:hypothetical protein